MGSNRPTRYMTCSATWVKKPFLAIATLAPFSSLHDYLHLVIASIEHADVAIVDVQRFLCFSPPTYCGALSDKKQRLHGSFAEQSLHVAFILCRRNADVGFESLQHCLPHFPPFANIKHDVMGCSR
jgi:hypothetical protein